MLEEVPRVRKDLGEPPLVTPSSQIVGTQAVLNVLMGERYKVATKETKDILSGKYGATAVSYTHLDVYKRQVTGFIRLNGMTVGAVANRWKVFDEEANVAEEFDGSLSANGAQKAADFVRFCDAFNIPVLTLTNVSGFKASDYDEKHLAAAAARLAGAFAEATVPKVNVITGKAFGNAYVVMNSKSTGADMVYAWPSSQIGMMEPALAAKIMYADGDAATQKEKAAEYAALQDSPLSAAARGYVDTIIQPADTRKYVIGAFEMLFTKREDRPAKKHGTV